MNVNKVVIELLYKNGCPACIDIIEMVKSILAELGDYSDSIDFVTLDLFKDNERVVELGMYKCPSLAINGTVHYVGTKPTKEELKNLIVCELSKLLDIKAENR
ncbi:thioredoxin family protein [Persephonella hydrogeniphila]|uniref:thioredoxin family protein n=1 Tax=Persephonella hydrogeniphila TaxID=198703 RepID=UPI0015DE1474|nr:thioredoxin family protein [Persephonella hydrogeniphila]